MVYTILLLTSSVGAQAWVVMAALGSQVLEDFLMPLGCLNLTTNMYMFWSCFLLPIHIYPWFEANGLPTSGAQIMNEWSSTFLPPPPGMPSLHAQTPAVIISCT